MSTVKEGGFTCLEVERRFGNAAKLEHDNVNRSRVLREGIDHIPNSVQLWKAVVELANEEDARLLL